MKAKEIMGGMFNMEEKIDSLVKAIESNDLTSIEEIVENSEGELIVNYMALVYSAVNDNIEVLSHLLKNSDNFSRETMCDALIQACMSDADNSVKYLIKNGKFINLANLVSELILSEVDSPNGMDSFSQFVFALPELFGTDNNKKMNLQVLKKLLDNGINTSALDKYGKTALQYAIDSKNDDFILEILKYHAYPRYKNEAMLGYVLNDLDIAKNDLEYLINSEWFKEIKEIKLSIKEKLKLILNSKSEEELRISIQKITGDNEKSTFYDNYTKNNNIIEEAKKIKEQLRKEFNEVRSVLDAIEGFKSRIEINTKNKVFEIIRLYKEKSIKELTKSVSGLNMN